MNIVVCDETDDILSEFESNVIPVKGDKIYFSHNGAVSKVNEKIPIDLCIVEEVAIDYVHDLCIVRV